MKHKKNNNVNLEDSPRFEKIRHKPRIEKRNEWENRKKKGHRGRG